MKHDLLRYVIVPKNNFNPDALRVISDVYREWTGVWEKVFSSQFRNHKLQPDEFIRQDIAAAIYYESAMVGFHLYSFFDIRRKEETNHSYFMQVDPRSFDILRQQHLTKLMTMEYLTVLPQFRKHESGIPWGEVIISLGLKVMQDTAADAAFGTARRDVKVNHMAEKVGFLTLQKPIVKYDYECEVIYCPKAVRAHPDKETDFLINSLWSHRIDHRSSESIITQKKAA